MQKKRPGQQQREVPPALTTYSIRLEAAERALLTKALSVKGWKPTHFIRQATLEKAAQVDNTSRFTTFDFDVLARRLAKQLCQVAVLFWNESDEGPAGPYSLEEMKREIPDLERSYETTDPPPLGKVEVDRLRDAVKLGGTEFLRRVLEECDRIVKSPNELPSPIDPAQFT
jgi:hypothetical protein